MKPLYIDPGTGSMLFSILIGLIAAGMFFLQKLVIKVKFLLSGGRVRAEENKAVPYVIFSDSKRYWNVMGPVCDEFERRGIAAEYWTASEDDPALSMPYRHVVTKYIGSENQAFARLNLMRCDVCLATTPGLDVYQWKRSRNAKFYAHIFHMVDAGTSYRMFGLDYYDAVLLSGDFQEKYIRILEEKRGLPAKETVTVGCPYLDAMLERREAECTGSLPGAKSVGGEDKKETHLSSLPGEPLAEEKPQKTVLLAPSWGESAILKRFGSRILAALRDTGYHIIVRPHPQSFASEKELMDSLMKEFPENEQFEWNRDNDNFAVLLRSDIMITDFSGIIFDYALVFDRPLIYADTRFDTAPYDAAWIDDEEYWTLQILPKLGVRLAESDFPHLKEVIDGVTESEEYAAGRAEIRDTVWQHRGHAAERTVDYLVAKRESLAAGSGTENPVKKEIA